MKLTTVMTEKIEDNEIEKSYIEDEKRVEKTLLRVSKEQLEQLKLALETSGINKEGLENFLNGCIEVEDRASLKKVTGKLAENNIKFKVSRNLDEKFKYRINLTEGALTEEKNNKYKVRVHDMEWVFNKDDEVKAEDMPKELVVEFEAEDDDDLDIEVEAAIEKELEYYPQAFDYDVLEKPEVVVDKEEIKEDPFYEDVCIKVIDTMPYSRLIIADDKVIYGTFEDIEDALAADELSDTDEVIKAFNDKIEFEDIKDLFFEIVRPQVLQDIEDFGEEEIEYLDKEELKRVQEEEPEEELEEAVSQSITIYEKDKDGIPEVGREFIAYASGHRKHGIFKRVDKSKWEKESDAKDHISSDGEFYAEVEHGWIYGIDFDSYAYVDELGLKSSSVSQKETSENEAKKAEALNAFKKVFGDKYAERLLNAFTTTKNNRLEVVLPFSVYKGNLDINHYSVCDHDDCSVFIKMMVKKGFTEAEAKDLLRIVGEYNWADNYTNNEIKEIKSTSNMNELIDNIKEELTESLEDYYVVTDGNPRHAEVYMNEESAIAVADSYAQWNGNRDWLVYHFVNHEGEIIHTAKVKREEEKVEEAAQGKKEPGIEFVVYDASTDGKAPILGIRSTRVEAEWLVNRLMKTGKYDNVSYDEAPKGRFHKGDDFWGPFDDNWEKMESLQEDIKKVYRIIYWEDEDLTYSGQEEVYEEMFDDLEDAKKVVEEVFDDVYCVQIVDENDDVVFERCSKEVEEEVADLEEVKEPCEKEECKEELKISKDLVVLKEANKFIPTKENKELWETIIKENKLETLDFYLDGEYDQEMTNEELNKILVEDREIILEALQLD